ncbi:AAA family ATPase (plasmid) [Streptomyces sp. NBC_01525]|uniref:ATP-binding protein n=1 Tax=Streptomyces sp. NBC_01525 TaxID=2903893 RepID=UPI002F91A682
MANCYRSMTPNDHAMIAARAPIATGTLVALIGPAGSGKTQFTHGVPSHEVICLDALRAMVSGDPGDQDATAEAVRLQNILIDARLTRSQTLYLDSTNVEVAVRARLVERARRQERPLLAIVFTTPLDICLRRNSERPTNRRVPPDVLR